MKMIISALCLILGFSILSLSFVSPDFSGTWIRDAERSEPVGSMDGLLVRQSNTSLDVQSISIQNPSTQAGEVRTPFGSIVRGDTRGAAKSTYLLDGNEHSITVDNGNSRSYQVTPNGNQLIIESANTTNTPFGPAVKRSKEEWSLSADGRTLVITSTISSAMGTVTQRRVYTKQP